MTTAASQKLGRVVDLSWAPLPAPAGGGSAIMVATEDGALAFVDVAQSTEQSTRRQRCAHNVSITTFASLEVDISDMLRISRNSTATLRTRVVVSITDFRVYSVE